MTFIHLSDLHLGKRVNEFSMIDDQKYILIKILNIIDDLKPNCVVIAGDIYDKGIPPVEAVELFDDFLNRLAQRKLSVLMISGNHDSPERLTFGSRLMKASGIHIAPVYDGTIQVVTLEDEAGPVNFYLLPYLKPSTVRQFFPDQEIDSYSAAVKTALSQIKLDENQRNVLVAHQFVTGASICESEELYVGGSENVDASLFEDFDYVALGHIHGPQKVVKENIRYCGTPLKYSFSECNHKKGVGFVELVSKGKLKYTSIPLEPKRDMREIRGSYDEIMLKKNYENTNTDDYVHITLTDEKDIPEGFGKIRTVYPNLMKLDYDNSRTKMTNQIDVNENSGKLNPTDLFDEFFELQNNKKMDDEQKKFVSSLVDDIWGGQR